MQIDISFCLAISHTPWVPERVESFKALRAALKIEHHEHGEWPDFLSDYLTMSERAPNHVWSEKMWEWAAATDVTHCVFLQDDVSVAPNFWAALRALVTAYPQNVIGLEAVHPVIPYLMREGAAGVTTADGLIGTGYIVPRSMLQDFLNWRANDLNERTLPLLKAQTRGDGEDTLMGVWCLHKNIPILHPIPTLIDHDTELKSTYGNDNHEHRRPLVRWDNFTFRHFPDLSEAGPEIMANPNFWRRGPVVHAGRFYTSTPTLLANWVKEENLSEEELRRARRDNGEALKRRIIFSQRARGEGPEGKVFVATPTTGQADDEHLWAMRELWRSDVELEPSNGFEMYGERGETADVVRTRSRMVAFFLDHTDATHLLFVDSDIRFTPDTVRGMMRAKKGIVVAPYPRRDGIEWGAVRVPPPGGETAHPEAHAYKYNIHPFEKDGMAQIDVEKNTFCAPIRRAGLGMCLISREVLEKMVAKFAPDLSCYDQRLGQFVTMLFQLGMEHDQYGRRVLLGEDISFFERAQECGETIWCYFGPGSPVDHVGRWIFKGHLEKFGMKREKKEAK